MSVPPRRGAGRFATNMVAATATNIGRGVIGFASGIIVARALGPLGRGEYSAVTTSALILVMLAAVGMPSALTQARAKVGRSIAELYSASVLVAAAGAVLTLVLGAAFYLVAGSRVLRLSQPADLVWVAIVLAPLLVLNHWTAVAYLEDRIKEFGLASIAGALFFLGSVAIARLAGQLSASLAIALWAVASILPLAVMVRRRRLQISPGLREVAVGLIRFSLRANVATLALILVWRVDVLLVDWQRGLRELGLYSVAVALAEILLQGAVSARVALTPLQGSPEGREELVVWICRLNRVMLAGLSLLALLVGLSAGIVLRFTYGPAFAAAAPALVWILPGVVALVLQGPLIDYLVTEGKVRDVSLICVFALLINVAINVVFLPHHSFVVAAVASTVAYVLSSGLCLAAFARHTGVRVSTLMIVRRSDIDVVSNLAGGLFASRR